MPMHVNAYNSFNLDNIEMSCTFLLESLGPDLSWSMELKSDDTTPGPVLWVVDDDC